MAWGSVPAAKGEPGTAVNAPVVVLTAKAETSLLPSLPTKTISLVLDRRTFDTDNCVRGCARGSRCADDCERAGGRVDAIGRERIVRGIGDVGIQSAQDTVTPVSLAS